MEDSSLLRRYAASGDQDAFAQLVHRHGPWVYLAARRQLVDEHLAEDAAQAVFMLLARRAGRLAGYSYLGGWLFNTMRYTVRAASRQRALQQEREREVARMRNEATEAEWEQVGPVLDEAVGRLSKADRNLLVLRFYQQMGLAEVGQALGISEEAARKRVNRAVVRLREVMAKKDVTISAAGLSMMVSEKVSEDVPARIVSSMAGMGSAGNGATETAGTIAQGAAKMMIWGKIKTATLLLLATTLACGMGIGVEVLRQAGTEGSQAAAPAIPSHVKPTCAATLTTGVTVELAAVYLAFPDAADPGRGQWFRSDGDGPVDGPYEVPRMFYQAGTPAPPTPEFAIRLTSPAGVDVELIPKLDGISMSHGQKPGLAQPPNSVWSCKFHTDAPSISVRFYVPTSDWRTHYAVRYHNAKGEVVTDDRTCMIYLPVSSGNSQSTVKLDIGERLSAEEVLVVAVDDAGAEHKQTRLTTTVGQDKIRHCTATFSIGLDRITAVQVRTRSNGQWVEFRNVSLRPGVITDIKVVTSDDRPTTAPSRSNEATAN